MYVNENGKYTSSAEYFFNDYIEMYCVIDTTISMQYLDELMDLWESPDLLEKVDMPKYITEDYDEAGW